MTDSLIDDGPGPVNGGPNTPEFSVSEISGAVKRMVEGEFGHVRVRGEIGRVSRPPSGHVYLDLKDDRAVLSGVVWKGQAATLAVRPEEGLEVVATGRLTTFPGQSKYQIVIESLAYAGEGALLAQLERLKKTLAKEGLFDAQKKRPLPRMPRVIGVVTSPSGAVIRDILHRLSERFPVEVLLWPVTVQGERCPGEVAAAIRGFSALAPEGPVPRPDVVIVARGGGSVEDLWGFNSEAVVRAAAASTIPLISAVGHETDTTLLDIAADRRAHPPPAAAELAVPVRAELVARLAELDRQAKRAMAARLDRGREAVRALDRALPRAETLLEIPRQRLDLTLARMPRPDARLAQSAERVAALAGRLPRGLLAGVSERRAALAGAAGRLGPRLLASRIASETAALARSAGRLEPAATRHRQVLGDRLAALARLLTTLSYTQTLARGYAVVRRGDGQVTTRAAQIAPPETLEIEFADGRIEAVTGGPPPRSRPKRAAPVTQPSLFEDE